jgi:RNA polymerase sigma factor (sigma-70 family)
MSLMLNHDQNELLAQFRSGDRIAFEHVFRLFLKPLRLNAFLILRNEQEAEDLVQQLFLDIWNQRLYQNIQTSLKAYLHTSIKHRCLNYLKSLSRQTKNLQEYAGQQVIEDAEMDEPPSPQLLTILDGLPAQQLKAFNLVHMENKRYQEAAEEMGISINSLKSHLKLAVKFVRIKLKASPIHPYNK